MTRSGRTIEPIWVEWPYARIRRSFLVHDGVPERFVVQLEYNLNAPGDILADPDWAQVARFDHEPDNPMGHDVTEEGLHMDVYFEGQRVTRVWEFPDVTLQNAISFCEQFLLQNATQLLGRFERWHGIENGYSSSSSR